MTMTPPTKPTPPTVPDRSNRTAFPGQMYDFQTYMAGDLIDYVNDAATNVKANADEAVTAANTATTQASNASTSASNAATSASNASAAASTATSAANSAAASYDAFDDRYLGNKSSDPSVDNDGNTLLVGALYFNTGTKSMRVWNGTAWDATYLPSSGYQQTLVSGTNIKTIGGRSVLGAGDLPTGAVYEFTGSGTFTKPAVASVIIIELWGGGGGGPNSTVGTTYLDGASGGEYVYKLFKDSDVGATETVTIGLGGTGGANGTTISSGNDGGDTSFGSLLIAKGGRGGMWRGSSLPTSCYPGTTENTNIITYSVDNATLLNILRNVNFGRGGFSSGGSVALCSGGNTLNGGGGGGAISTSAYAGVGGTSKNGGNGGNANMTAGVKGGNGSFPGGGGGASSLDGGGGDGANGFCRITVW